MASKTKRQASPLPKAGTKKFRASASKSGKAELTAEQPLISPARKGRRVTTAEAARILEKPRTPSDDNWPQAFCNQVEETESEILSMLSAVKDEVVEDQKHFQRLMLPILRNALLPLDKSEAISHDSVDEDTLKVQVTAMGHQACGDHIADLIDASHKLLQTYRELSTAQASESRLDSLSSTFQKDEDAALITISAGRRVASRDIHNVLTDRYHQVRESSSLTRDEQLSGTALLFKGQEETEENPRAGLGWATVANEANKAVGKLNHITSRS